MLVLLLPFLALPMLLAGHALWRWRSLRLPAVRHAGRVTLVLPLTGAAPGLEGFLAALAAQTLQPRRLVVGVEDEGDPAAARVRSLAPSCPFPVELRFAGTAARRSQKNSNLIAAFAAIDASDEAVVMCDGDIRPPPWWLSAAASPAIAGTHDVITGFRWQLLHGRGAFGQVVAWLDRMAATLIMPPRFSVVWGGTIGFSRRAIAVLDLPRLLDGALLDDATIGQAARARGLVLMTRGALTVPTPVEGGALVQLRFFRRQMQFLRICLPRAWVAVMLLAHLVVAGWVMAVLALPHPLAIAVVVATALGGVARAIAQAGIAARIGSPDPPAGLAAQVLVGALTPLPEALVALLGWTMLRTRRLRWRHVEYEIAGPHAVRVVARATHVG